MNVVSLDDYRPHFCLCDPKTDNINIVPESLVERWATGDMVPDEQCVRALAQFILEECTHE